MEQDSASLPPEIADRFTRPFARFLKVEAAAGALLLLATFAALILSNSAWSTAFLAFWETPIGLHFGSLDFTRSLRHWINDALMTLFFFVVALELKRELILGELRNLRMAALSFAGALGGMLVPAALYLSLMTGQPGMHGWGTVMATDTAFVIGCLALFGSRIPPTLRLFLLSLAIFDDVGAILVVAIGYGDALNWGALALGLVGLAVVAGTARIGIRSVPVFFLLGGMIWLCFDASGVHPTIAGVVLGLMTPTRGWISDERLRAILGRVLSYPIGDRWSGDTTERRDLRRAGAAATEALSPVERLEMMLHPWVAFAIMPVFALANAGVAISGADFGQPVSVVIFAGLVFGKPIGVLTFSWLVMRLGLATRAPGLSWPLLAAGAFLTGIGFTMSLFIAGLAYAPAMLDAAKVGVLTGSVASAAAGVLMLAWLTTRKRTT
ncbi:MAG TPA: Na+/H+ antiporter NhaA [Gammaproteobacteria bacterium]|nr:Na+/H+ antiporter NhaA [Gammaproteobacteria bacterium]